MNAVILENGHVHFCERRIEVAEKDEETLSTFSKIDTWSFENRCLDFRKSTFTKHLGTAPQSHEHLLMTLPIMKEVVCDCV
jgi:hypothetical protein